VVYAAPSTGEVWIMQEPVLADKAEQCRIRSRLYYEKMKGVMLAALREQTRQKRIALGLNGDLPPHVKDLAGKRFGMLIVTKFAGVRRCTYGRKTTEAMWECLCDCGKTKVSTCKSLTAGHCKSCGCIKWRGLMQLGDTPQTKLRYGEARCNDLFTSYKRSARARNITFELQKEDFKLLTKGSCFYCGVEPKQVISAGKSCYGSYVYNGIDRVDNTAGYVTGNVRSCCKACNTAKSTMTEQEFYAWVERVYLRTPTKGHPTP
jgi:hypothetical protein